MQNVQRVHVTVHLHRVQIPLTFWDFTMPKCFILRGRRIFVEKTEDTKCSFLLLSGMRNIAHICNCVHELKITPSATVAYVQNLHILSKGTIILF